MVLQFIPTHQRDIDVLTDIMKRAFEEDSMMHIGKKIGPPGYNNGDFIRKWCFNKNVTSFTIQIDDNIIGCINLFINHQTNINVLGSLFIDPDYKAKGIGTAVWRQIEQLYPHTKEWHTETICHSIYNHYFYVSKCGFQIVAIDNPHKNLEAQYKMIKKM